MQGAGAGGSTIFMVKNVPPPQPQIDLEHRRDIHASYSDFLMVAQLDLVVLFAGLQDKAMRC